MATKKNVTNLAHHDLKKKALVCGDCIRKGTHDIFILVREPKDTNEFWAKQAELLVEHKEQEHGE